MEEQLSQERFNTLESFASNHCDLIPETDSSDKDDSQPFQATPVDENDVTIGEALSESNDDRGAFQVRPSQNNNDLIEETEPSESYNSQAIGSQPEFVAGNEINIPATASESDENRDQMADHASVNVSTGIVYNNTPMQRYFLASPTNYTEISTPHSNHSQAIILPIHNDTNADHEVSESDGSQISNNQFAIDTEIIIPETPSQSENEQDVDSNYSQEVDNSQSLNHSQHSNLNPVMFSVTLSQAEDDVLSEVANTIELSDEMRTGTISPDLFDELDDIINSQNLNQSQHSNLNAPAIFSVAFNQLEDDVLSEAANTIELSDEMRTGTISPDLFDEPDDIVPNSLNIAEPNVSTPPAIRSPDMFEDDDIDAAPYESQYADEVVPPIAHDVFQFLVPDVQQNNRNLVSPVEVHDSPVRDDEVEEDDEDNDDDDDDDDRTIIRGENEPIQISAASRIIIERIERFVHGIINDLKNGQKIQIVVQSRRDWTNCYVENERFNLLPIADAQCRHIKSTFTLSIIFYMLSEIHEMLLTNTKCTLRELYYKNVNVTQKQENVNEALKTICCLLDATPWELGVLSTSKGLIAGPLQIHLPDDVVIDCGIDRNGIILPHLTSGIIDLRTTASYVLVVEKDTVFKKLLQFNILERWKNACILITGKGYPDTNTRLILNKLRELHTLPIHVFTDADPYGIEIMLTYRHGSMAMSNLAAALAVPSVRWLGIFPSDIRKFGIQSMALTAEDHRKLDNILNRPFINDHVHRELLIMKQANVKAEIEGISNSSCSYLIDVYLRNKIDKNDGI